MNSQDSAQVLKQFLQLSAQFFHAHSELQQFLKDCKREGYTANGKKVVGTIKRGNMARIRRKWVQMLRDLQKEFDLNDCK